MRKPLSLKSLVSKIKTLAKKCQGVNYTRVKRIERDDPKNWWNGVVADYSSGTKEILICIESKSSPRGYLNLGDDEANYFVITCPKNMLKLIEVFEKRTKALEMLSKGGCDSPEKHYTDIAQLALKDSTI